MTTKEDLLLLKAELKEDLWKLRMLIIVTLVAEEGQKALMQRIEDVNKNLGQRIEGTNQRIEDLRADMNQRAEDLRADMNQRFEGVDNRFADLNFWLQMTFETSFATLGVVVLQWATTIRRTTHLTLR